MEKPKQSKGSVGLEVFRNKLRLRLPRSLFNGNQTYLSLGADDTKLNRKIAEQKIRQIEADILSNNFDFTLAKYKSQTPLASVAHLKPWKHISNKSICFEQAVVNSVNGLVLKDGLKTQNKRNFPVNAQLLELLDSMRQGLNVDPNALVFPAPTGKGIDAHNFRNRAWKTIMSSLNMEYRKPY